MRSSLSRNAYRRLRAFTGLSVPASALSVPKHVSLRLARPCRALVRQPSRRTFLNLLKKPPRELKVAGSEPGFDTLVEFHARSIDNVQLPHRDELANAFRSLFTYKTKYNKAVNSTQALCAIEVLQYLQKHETEGPALTEKDLWTALQAIAISPRRGETERHVTFATAVYECLKSLKYGSQQQTKEDRYTELVSPEFERYITCLTQYGASQEAAEIISKLDDLGHRFNISMPNAFSDLHMLVLKGFAKEQAKPRVVKYADQLLHVGHGYTSQFQRIMTSFYASIDKDDIRLRRWFEQRVVGGHLPEPRTYTAVISWSSRTGNNPDWVKKAIQELCDSNPPKLHWDVVLYWAVRQGKDIRHIRHMIDVMAKLNQQDENVRVDIFSLNEMLEAAVESQNYLLAERLNALASEMGLRPNARTHTRLLEARIAGKDTSGALSAFNDLIYSGPLQSGSTAIEVVNRFIRYLCSTIPEEPLRILDALGHVEENDGELEPETVVSLCLLFLKNDRSLEVIDTLGLHLKQFSLEERRIVKESLMGYCLDKNISTARAWDCYSLIRQFFPEASRGDRVKLMNGFFERKRADMACHIFGHMRAHPNDNIRPDLDAYVDCLEGLGAHPDTESLHMVHNMFKMDSRIEPTTRLYNAFMIAHAGCEEYRRALTFWQQISESQEGPSYRSMALVFRACQDMPFGYDKARPVWDKMHRLQIDIPIDVYDAYVLMTAGQGELEETKRLLLSRLDEYKKGPDHITLAHVFNAIPVPDLQQDFKEWASLEFPLAWEKLQKIKTNMTAEGTDRYLVRPRKLTA